MVKEGAGKDVWLVSEGDGTETGVKFPLDGTPIPPIPPPLSEAARSLLAVRLG